MTKDNGQSTSVPGSATVYTVAVINAGSQGDSSVSVSDNLPAGLNCTSWSSVAAGGATGNTAVGSGNIADTLNMPIGSSVTYTMNCTVASDAVGSLSNTASATASVTDIIPSNNSATDTDTLTPQADLAITKTDGVTTATPGGSVTYTITASNAGPSNAAGTTVADTFPATLTCAWTCVGAGGGTCAAAGAGNLSDTVNLPSGGSVTYTASCSVSAAATGTLSNTATVAAPGGVTDPTPGNNSATDSDTLAASADLSITKTDGVTTAAPGGSVTYTITAANAGPSNATGATVADTFPATLTCAWTCVGAGGGTCTASGSGNLNDTVNLPSGGSATYTASCTIAASATGPLSNTATVAAPGGVTDPTPGNNSATDSDTLSASADLSITKTDNSTTYTPGGSTTYTITASNAGPSNATGATVADTFPATLTCAWTCVGAGGGTCTAAGAGNLSDTVNLPSGGSATYTASCTIAASATGPLSNTATVAAPGGVTDPTPGNNSATDTDSMASIFDPPSGRKTVDGTGAPVLEWRMVWINNGNTTANRVRVVDPIPAGTTYVAGSLSCTTPSVASPPSTIATCQVQGAPPNQSVVYEGNIAPDPGATDETQAQNEVVIVFQTRLDTGVTTASNTASASWDRNGNDNLDDDNITPVTTNNSTWSLGAAINIPTLHPLLLTLLATALAWLLSGLQGRLGRQRR